MQDDNPGLRERKKRAVRQTLYDTALTLFRREGFDAVPVSAICAEAGVAKGTFFNHFPTKDHVLLEWYERMASTGNAMQPVQGSALERLIALTDGFFDIALADADLWRAKQQRAALSADFREAEMASDARTKTVIEALVKDAMADGELRGDLDAKALGDLILAILTGSVHDWTLSNGKLNIKALVRQRLETLICALAKPA